MATKIKTLENNSGDIILPRTVAKAVTLEDGSTLEYALENRDTEDVKLTDDLANQLGLPLGTTLSSVLVNINRTLAVAPTGVLDATVE